MKKPLSNLDEVYWKIADKYKLRKEVVENIVENQFRFVNEIIKNSDVFNLDTLKEVNITYLGKYKPKIGRILTHLKKWHPEEYKKLEEDGTKDNI